MQRDFYIRKWPRFIRLQYYRFDIYPIWKTARKIFKAFKILRADHERQIEIENLIYVAAYVK